MALRPGRETGFLGMRGMLNRSYGFTARFGEAAIFDEPYPLIARATMTPTIHILWAALWSGMAAEALDRSRRFVAEEADEATAPALSLELTRLGDLHHAMNALIRDAIADQERPESVAVGIAATARIKRLKLLASNMVVEICIGAIKLIGLRAYALGGPYSLATLLRDALSAPIMVSNHRLATANAGIERFIEEEL
jgi:acyl-CoA dehydrogenase